MINPTGLTPSWVATVDLDNDGIADLVTANTGAGSVSIFLGNGDGTFQPMPDLPTGVNPVWVMAADFNLDGLQDLAVINSGDASVAVLLGNGDGTFQPVATLALGSLPIAAVISDFNGDGNPDLAVIDANNGTVTTLFGEGNGGFWVGSPTALGFIPSQIAAADFNGDGNDDLAISGTAPDGVVVLLGNAGGLFTAGPLLGAGTNPSSLTAADFNGDGLVDLVVGDYGDLNSLSGGGIQILLGNGDGTFAIPIVAASGPNVAAIATADFDGDGKPDLGAISGGGFSVFLGNGDGTLQAPQSYAAGDSATALAIGSFDGTGLTEVAVANQVVNQTESGELDVLTGSPGTCQYALSPPTLLFDAAGAGGALTLTTSATGCPWTVSSAAWIVPATPPAMGGASISFQVLPNATGFDRVGTVVAGGQTLTISQRATAAQFTDVPASAYYFDAANLMKEQDITSGCGTSAFCPAEQVSRAQMAVLMVNSIYGADRFTSSPEAYFADVPPGSFGFRWIQKLYELGITAGCGTNLYCPGNAVTRAQMAVFVIRARFGSTASFSFPATPYFTNVPSGAFAFSWIQRMRLEGITDGCNATLYCPDNPVTRGDMAIFIMRALFNDLSVEGTPTLVSVSPSVLVPNQPAAFTLTGSGTGFVQGQTTVSTVPGVTVTNVQVLGPTTLTVTLSADSSAPVQPVGLVAITGAEQDVLPNGLTIQ